MMDFIRLTILAAAFSMMAVSTQAATDPLTEVSVGKKADIERHLETMIYRVVNLYDRQDYSNMVALFTDDARYSSPTRGDLVGRDQIAEAMAKRPKHRLTRHAITNVVVTVTGDNTATATSIVLAYLNNDAFSEPKPVPYVGPVNIADYVFAFRKVDGIWLISAKTTHAIFHGELGVN